MSEDLKARVRAANPPFEGMERRKYFPPAEVFKVGREWATETGEPVGAAITKACAAYWSLWEEWRERRKK